MAPHYIFRSDRLGFRNWVQADIQYMSLINADPKVMEFFPGTATTQQTEAFIARQQKQFAEKGFCYFAVDRLDNNEFIGFTGISQQTFESNFTPCIDIGWRLAQKEWGNGFATEGAKTCLQYAFDILGLHKIVSICPVVNTRSEAVMQKTGMHKKQTFIHPLLVQNEHLKHCVLYEIENENTLAS